MNYIAKIITVSLCSLLFVALPSAKAQLIISEVDPAGSSSAYAADWFELTNTGSGAVDITGWKMDDSSDAFGTAVPMSLAGNSIAPGQSVIFFETANLASVTSSFETAWFGTNIPSGFTTGSYSGSGVGLSTGGDAVNIFNSSGTEIVGVNFGAAPGGGATFNNTAGLGGTSTATNPTLSTASAVGVNGAFASLTTSEVGSPGAVPEPTTWALVIGGMLTLVALKFRGHRSFSSKA